MRKRLQRTLLASLIGALALASSAAAFDDGDAAWAARAEGRSEERAAPGPVEASIDAYQRAVDARPAALEPRWKLLRSLHFLGVFAQQDEDARRRTFERATEVSEAALDLLAERAGQGTRLDELDADALAPRIAEAGLAPEDVARLHFWSALGWGSWAEAVGLLGAVREGAAGRLRRYANVTAALEPGYEGGGAFRLLGALHASLPRVPFLSGWVDRDRALPLVRRAYDLAPEHPGNQLLLATTLLDRAPDRREEAVALLRPVAALTPRPDAIVEDLVLRKEARRRLEPLAATAD